MSATFPGDGFLLLDKPVGRTSHDIVAIVRRTLGERSVGHTGTLDPFASGLLLLCLGRATRLAEYLGGFPKEYLARARLGITTDTDDPEGKVIGESDAWERLERSQVVEALNGFLGESEQRPPAFSAKKVGGKAAYSLARRGQNVVIAPSRVVVHRIELVALTLPAVDFRVSCSTGTYVRALARDFGEILGTGAHLTELRRLAIGPFHVDNALTLDDLGDGNRVRERWVSPLQGLSHLRQIEITSEEARRVRMGQAVTLEVSGKVGDASPGEGAPGVLGEVALSLDGELVGTARIDGQTLHPRKVFPKESAEPEHAEPETVAPEGVTR